MNRAIAVLGLAGLLCAGILAASDEAPLATSGEAAGLCVAATPSLPELPGLVRPVPRAACSATALCPDGSAVSCDSTWPEECDTYYTCSPPYVQCAARCVNNIRYCAGFNSSNCFC